MRRIMPAVPPRPMTMIGTTRCESERLELGQVQGSPGKRGSKRPPIEMPNQRFR